MNLDKFTDRARGFLQSAQTVAIRMSHQRIGPEHLLKALLEDDEGMAAGGRVDVHERQRAVVLVDDGLATGATMRAAVIALRRSAPARLVVAVPVGPPDSCRRIDDEADEVLCLATPDPFQAVGLWYRDFPQTRDEEVRELLDEELVPRLAEWLGGRDSRLRAEAVYACFLGVHALQQVVGTAALERTDPERLVAVLAPMLQACVDDPATAAARRATEQPTTPARTGGRRSALR